jgi:hypothetical protein
VDTFIQCALLGLLVFISVFHFPLLESLLEESQPVETGMNVRGFAAERRAAAALDLAAATKRPSASKSDAAEQFE